MGKKGSWFSAIKRIFTHNSEGSNKKNDKEKKKGQGALRHGETKSLIPLFRKPSSIEKILGEADELLIRPPTSFEHQITPPALPERPASPRANSPKAGSRRACSPRAITPRAASPRAVSPRATSPKAASPRAISPRAASPKAASPRAASSKAASSKAPSHPKINQKRKEIKNVHPELTLSNQHLFATKIQAAYRGYLARKSFKALRGLVRLQGVVRGQNVRRQTMNAMKQMQLLVRVQTQIQSRRIQTLENQALQHQAYRNEKEVESTLSKWISNKSEAGDHEDWHDSLLTKEEEEARLRKKVEAVIKRERAMAYAHSQKLWKANPRSAHTALDIRFNGFPWWWNWLEHKLPLENSSQSQNAAKTAALLTPPRPISEYKPSPRLHPRSYKHITSLNNHESSSPRSSRSAIPFRAKQYRTPSRTPPPAKASPRTRASPSNSAYNVPLKDDDSLMSCPPFSVRSYMAPTVSTKAKIRANSNPKERIPGTPGSDSKRRFSFPLTPNAGSFKWNKGGSNKDTYENVLEKHQSVASIGDLSIDSAVSMPTAGRKPFNRFV